MNSMSNGAPFATRTSSAPVVSTALPLPDAVVGQAPWWPLRRPRLVARTLVGVAASVVGHADARDSLVGGVDVDREGGRVEGVAPGLDGLCGREQAQRMGPTSSS